MTCKNCNTKSVWEFTNKTKLCKKCFVDYVERKVFATIRKYEMFPSDRIFRLKREGGLNYKVLKTILEKKFSVSNGNKFSSENLSSVSEKIFDKIIKGDFKKIELDNCPLLNISDKEIELYAKLNNIKGKKRVPNKRIRILFERFSKNPDLEHNILNAFLQLK